MPVQQGKSQLAAKYGAKLDAAAKKHAADPVDTGFQQLPGGIRNGIAELVECGFFTYDANTKVKKSNGQSAAGELYFRAAGVVLSPTHVESNGSTVMIKGQQTSVMETICETKNSKGAVISVEDHVKAVQNYLKMLGATAESVDSAEGIESTAAALKEQRPHFKFSTSEGKPSKEYPTPRVFENWHGLATDYVPDGGEDPALAGVTGNGQPPTGAGPAEPAQEPDAPTAADSGSDDVDALVARADAKPPDAEACDRLKQMALAAGVEEDAVAEADNWAAVAELIANATPAAEGAAEPAAAESPAETDWEPKKGEPYKYQLKDKDGKPLKSAKTKRPVKHDVEVTAVDKKSKTVNLKDLDDGKSVYKGVPWDELEEN